jgi:predicted transcriptional regulator
MKRDRAKQELSPEDREALERSAEDVRRGRFATDEEVRRIFDRYQRNEGAP